MELTAFQLACLRGIAKYDRPNGLQVKDYVTEEEAALQLDAILNGDSVHESEINHGRLYPNLDRLVEMGLVEKGQEDLRTNWYDLTQEGEQVLEHFKSNYENTVTA